MLGVDGSVAGHHGVGGGGVGVAAGVVGAGDVGSGDHGGVVATGAGAIVHVGIVVHGLEVKIDAVNWCLWMNERLKNDE